MDPQTAMETATEGAKALTKFQEIVQKVFGPRWTRKQADAEAYADEKKLQMIRNNPDMEIVYVHGQINARERTSVALAMRAEQRRLVDSVRQEDNLENVLDIAGNELKQTKNVSDTPVDEDWITRFFNIAKDINTAEMQLVWGKILAGEIISPGRFSFRTLETIKNMSKSDAEIFQKVIPLIANVNNTLFLTSSKDILGHNGVLFADVLALDECGLLNSSSTLSLTLTLPGHGHINCYTDERIIVIKNGTEDTKKISFGVYTFTKPGTELFNVLAHASNNDYIFELAEEIWTKSKENSVEMSIHQIKSIVDGEVNYTSLPIKSFKKES